MPSPYPHAYTDRDVGEGFGDYPSVLSWIPASVRPLIYANTAAADVSAYIQNALSDLSPGQTLFFPQGTYPLSGSGSAILTISQLASLRGDTNGGTVFLVLAGVPNTRDVFLFTGSLSKPRISDFQIQGQLGPAVSITGVTNAAPMVVHAPAHGFATGQVIVQSGVLNSGSVPSTANGKHVVTVVDANHYSLSNWDANGPSVSQPNGAYASGGTAQALPGRHGLAFDITNPIQGAVIDNIADAANSLGGCSLCTLPSNPPSLNGNYFLNRHLNCQFGNGVNLNCAGDSNSFLHLETSGDNVGIWINLVSGATSLSIRDHNSTSWRGGVGLIHGDNFLLENPDMEIDNNSAYPNPGLVHCGYQNGGQIAATCGSITGGSSPQVIAFANVTNLSVGMFVRFVGPNTLYYPFWDACVTNINGNLVTCIVLLSFTAVTNAPVNIVNARVRAPRISGGSITTDNPLVPRCVVMDYADGGRLDGTLTLQIGYGPSQTAMAWFTGFSTGCSLAPAVATQIPNLAGRLLEDDSTHVGSLGSLGFRDLSPYSLSNAGAQRDQAGVVQAFGFTEPLTGGFGVLQNLITFSRAYSNAAWTKSNCMVLGGVSLPVAPDITQTATVLQDSSDSVPTLHYASFGITKANLPTKYTFAVWVLGGAGNLPAVNLTAYSTLGGSAFASFDLTSNAQPNNFGSANGGSVSSFSNCYAYQVANPKWEGSSGLFWHLCVLTFTSDDDTTLSVYVSPEAVLGSNSYVGSGSGTIYLWDACIQEGNSLGPIFQTAGQSAGQASTPLMGSLSSQAAYAIGGQFPLNGGINGALGIQMLFQALAYFGAGYGHSIQTSHSATQADNLFDIYLYNGSTSVLLVSLRGDGLVTIPGAAAITGALALTVPLATTGGGSGGNYASQALLFEALIAAFFAAVGPIPTTQGGLGFTASNPTNMAAYLLGTLGGGITQVVPVASSDGGSPGTATFVNGLLTAFTAPT